MKEEPFGVGYPITRIINGKISMICRFKKKEVDMMDTLVELNNRHQQLLYKKDLPGLLKLADEYELRKISKIAREIRIQASRL